jgi:hypothetical protein
MKFNKKNIIKSSIFIIIFIIVVCFLIYYNSGCIEGLTLDIENDTDMNAFQIVV